MSTEEREIVEQAAHAIQRYEEWSQGGRPGKRFTGPTADEVVSRFLEEQGGPTDGEHYFSLIRAAAERAWGTCGRSFARPGQAEATGEDRAGYYDRFRPSGRLLDLLDRDAA